MRRLRNALLLTWFLGSMLGLASAETRQQALIIDGQNNHSDWPMITLMLRAYLEETELFEVDIARLKYLWKAEKGQEFLPLAGLGDDFVLEKAPMTDPEFAPDFSKYDLVISNLGHNAANWPAQTRKSFEDYVAGGGGFVAVHAANNSFPLWAEYNRMIGIGGWGGRTEKSGPYVFYNALGNRVVDESPGKGGTHGPQNEFLITLREPHPITEGLPETWKHAKDECYSKLRGPAENLLVLATASDTPALQEAGRNEPMLMTIAYGRGRVFHTTLGHSVESCSGVGFITTFQRGAEWAASGSVTLPVPEDFPGTDASTARA
ncbi:MAG: ThuA domain-containing protein, partial [Verrucomicrobiota bacterium]